MYELITKLNENVVILFILMVRSTALRLLPRSTSGPKWLNVHSEAILSHFQGVRDADSRDAYQFLIQKIHGRQVRCFGMLWGRCE